MRCLASSAKSSTALRPGLDHHVAHTRLQWWREECERAARGGAAHPLTRTLITALGDPQAKSVPQLAGLCGIVDVATWDLASATFETRRELEAYCQRWAAAMIEPLVAAAMSGASTATGWRCCFGGLARVGAAERGLAGAWRRDLRDRITRGTRSGCQQRPDSTSAR